MFMALTWPLGLFLFFWMLAPWSLRRYRLTNRRVIIETGPKFRAEQFVDLDRFNQIDIEASPGQTWYPAGDLVFKLGPVERLRLIGVGYPETFRQICLKAHQAYVGTRKAMGVATAGK